MGFHADPALLRHDPFDADYGCALYGHVTSASSYFVLHPQFGPSCFLCDWTAMGENGFEVVPRDSLQRRVYLEPIGSSVEVEVGRVVRLTVDFSAGQLNVTLAAMAGFSAHRVKVSHWALCEDRPGCGLTIVAPKGQEVRGAWVFPATASEVVVSITWNVSTSTTSLPDHQVKPVVIAQE